ncbi:follistatin [Parasteatoda tepidariorum]|uniref:follistatin n=1 Tax=Parasteatoda tepidariorum TaxID=114398 RepID=UPI00077FC7A7|nr:follistatin [Parasteatoda tepidariorum]
MIVPSPTALHHLVFLTLIIAAITSTTQGGQCWSLMNRQGKCTESLRTNVTKEECCSDGSATTAWSPKDLTSGDLFFWMSLGGGVTCKACKVSCEGVKCGKGMRCILRRQRPACVCSPTCSRKKRQMGEVCGSDGRTYKHICRLLKRQCRKNKQLTIEYFGKCQKTCDMVHCAGRKTCLLDQVLRPHCVRCQGFCPRASPRDFVCGGDNVTYSSSCHIRQAACVKGKAVPHAYKGKCKAGASCDNIRCRKGQGCLIDPKGGPPRCVTCPNQCQGPITEMLCASNNYTYSTWCHMMQDACKHGILLEAKHVGPCEETTSQQTNIIPLNVFDSQNHL